MKYSDPEIGFSQLPVNFIQYTFPYDLPLGRTYQKIEPVLVINTFFQKSHYFIMGKIRPAARQPGSFRVKWAKIIFKVFLCIFFFG